ncbi:MAG: grasp-with-spasm system SPASM domain peptide maturase [Bacteroidales bacterium]|nr:grasp-with-spasm system SPASM domain peptide maturase [Bacteroidales bacterium]
MSKKTFKLFPNVIPVVGYQNGILCDLFTGKIYMPPKDLIELLSKKFDLNHSKLVERYGIENKVTITEYLDFLIDRKLVFTTNKHISNCIPNFNLEWDCPSIITNIQIAIGMNSNLNVYKNTLFELSNLGCKAIGLIIEDMPLSKLTNFISFIEKEFNFILEISLEYKHNRDIESIIKAGNSMNKVVRINTFGSNQNKVKNSKIYHNLTFQWHTVPLNYMPCIIPSHKSFSASIDFFCEAHSYNTCLNRKLVIDSKGNVKNCLALQKSFGNIKNKKIMEILHTTEIKMLWGINKNQIDVCKECEFRYVCSDCRAFIKDPKNPLSQPSKCTYNPYIAKWQGEEGYVPVEECGTYTRETGFIVNHKRIEKLNSLIWKE